MKRSLSSSVWVRTMIRSLVDEVAADVFCPRSSTRVGQVYVVESVTQCVGVGEQPSVGKATRESGLRVVNFSRLR